ncbi:hypothetical protein L345_08270, partial [Ophiophagus hannah]
LTGHLNSELAFKAPSKAFRDFICTNKIKEQSIDQWNKTSTAIMKYYAAVCAMLPFDTIADKQHASLFKSSGSVVLESLEFNRGTSLLWQREVNCREQRTCLCSKEAFTRANIL